MTVVELLHEWAERYEQSIADVYRSAYDPQWDPEIEFLKIRVVNKSVNFYCKDGDETLIILLFRDLFNDEHKMEINLVAPDSLDRIKQEVDRYLGLSFVSDLYQR